MGRVQLEKLIASIYQVYQFNGFSLTLCGDAALVYHGIIKEVERPVFLVDGDSFQIASRNGKITAMTHPIFKRIAIIEKGVFSLFAFRDHVVVHNVEPHGNVNLETKSTLLMNMLLMPERAEFQSRIDKIIEQAGWLHLDPTLKQIELMEKHYNANNFYVDNTRGARMVCFNDLSKIDSVGIDRNNGIPFVVLKEVGFVYFSNR